MNTSKSSYEVLHTLSTITDKIPARVTCVMDVLAKRSVRFVRSEMSIHVIVMLLDLLQIMVYLSGVCFHRLGVMLFSCCSRFGFSIDDIMRLAPAFLVLVVVI